MQCWPDTATMLNVRQDQVPATALNIDGSTQDWRDSTQCKISDWQASPDDKPREMKALKITKFDSNIRKFTKFDSTRELPTLQPKPDPPKFSGWYVHLRILIIGAVQSVSVVWILLLSSQQTRKTQYILINAQIIRLISIWQCRSAELYLLLDYVWKIIRQTLRWSFRQERCGCF